MKHKLLALLTAVVTVVGMSTIAHATVTAVTTNADVNAQSIVPGTPDPGPPIDDVIELGYGTNGALVTNTIGAPAIGATIRTIGATVFNDVNILGIGSAVNGIRDPADPENQIVAIFGLEGTAIAPTGPGQFVARFTVGKLGYFPLVPNFSFDPDDPTTWDFALGSILGDFDLKPDQEFVVTGPVGDNVGIIPASDTQISSVNLAIGSDSQGIFLAEQADNPEIDPDFLTDFDLTGLDPTRVVGEGQVLFSDQEIVLPTMDLSPANVAILDAIGAWAFGAPLFGDVYDPTDPATTGDFQASLSLNTNPIVQVSGIPEPMTAGLGLLSLVGLGLATRRRR